MGTRLYVGNLPHDATAAALRSAFAAHGDVTDVLLVVDRETGRRRGFGFVTMASPEQAAQALEHMNGALLDGRPIRVNDADPHRR